MSKFNKVGPCRARRTGAALIGVIALGWGSVTFARGEPLEGVTLESTHAQLIDEAKPVGGSAQTAEDRAKGQKNPRSLLRCWQAGRQIFEGRGYTTLPQAQIAAELKSTDGATGRVQILDLYEGLCVLELPK
jgi:hypothetical protein